MKGLITLACILSLSASAFGADQIHIFPGYAENDHLGDSLRQTQQSAETNFTRLFGEVADLRAATNAGVTAAGVLATVDTNSAAWREQMKVDAPIRPQWYGAVGDGATDDTAAIKAAIDAASTNHGVVYFPPGIYNYSVGIEITNAVTLMGDNMTGGFDNNNTVVGGHLRYTGTNYALNADTPRLIIRDLRFSSTANARYGLKLKGEEDYFERVNIGCIPGNGFQIGIYCDGTSIGTFRDCIISCNTEIGMWLDTVTSSCNAVDLDRMHFYWSPIGLKLTYGSTITLSKTWFESVQYGVYMCNDSYGQMNLANISITDCQFLNNPANQGQYQQARFICITNSTPDNPMTLRGLRVAGNHVLNLNSSYDIQATFGAVTPVIERIKIEDNNFWASTNAAYKTDSALASPLFLNNVTATAPLETELPGDTPVASFKIQGTAPSLDIGQVAKENGMRFVAGKQNGWPAYIQIGTNTTDTTADLKFTRMNTGTSRIRSFAPYCDALDLHGELMIYGTDDIARMRLYVYPDDSSAHYLQLGNYPDDTNVTFRINRMYSATNRINLIELYANFVRSHGDFQVMGTDDLPGVRLYAAAGTGGIHYLNAGKDTDDTNAILRISRMNTSTSPLKQLDIYATDTTINGVLGTTSLINAGGYVRIPNNTWYYGQSVAGVTNIPTVGVDSANQVSIAPLGNTTVINGPLAMGSTNLLNATRIIYTHNSDGTAMITNTFTIVNGAIASWIQAQ